jgi:hypothetical protein
MSCGGCGKKLLDGAIGLGKVILRKDLAAAAVTLRRREICAACESNTTPGKMTLLSRCGQCSCLLEAKTQLKSEVCPNQPTRWGKFEQPSKSDGRPITGPVNGQ